MKRRADLFLFFLSPILLNLAFAPFPFRFFSYFSLIPLLYLIENSPTKKAILYSFLFYFLFALFHLWWLYFLVVPILGVTKFLLYIGIFVLFLYFGLYGLLFGLLVKKLGIFIAPFLWAVLEFIRTKSEIGFPWGLLGYTQMPYLPLIQFASLTGVYGVSAFVVFVNLIVYKLVFLPNKVKKMRWAAVLILAFLLPLSYGIFRIRSARGNFKVAIIQPNVSPYEKGEAESIEEILSSLFNLTNQALEEKPDILLYPETASLFDITKENWVRKEFEKISNLANVYLLIGTPIYEGGNYYNGAVLFAPEKGISGIYKKIHPVPFSERIPYVDKFPIFKPFATADMGDFTPGKDFTIFQTPFGKFSCLICFESIFPDLTREFALRGADILVNITNDGWFGKTLGPYQHCELAIMRSLELGKPLLRSANNGISLICDPYGRVVRKTKLFTKEILFGLLPKPLPPTVYQKFGDWFILLSLGIVILTVVKKIIKLKER
ncbi:MAG: apolipoprotein N-acyltransferase [candidate division WOR-3 bacterium]